MIDQQGTSLPRNFTIPFSKLMLPMPVEANIQDGIERIKRRGKMGSALEEEAPKLERLLSKAKQSHVVTVFNKGQRRVRNLIEGSIDNLSGAVLEELYTFALPVAAAVEGKLKLSSKCKYEGCTIKDVRGARLFSSDNIEEISKENLEALEQGVFYYALEPGRKFVEDQSVGGDDQTHPICDMFFIHNKTLVLIDVAGGGVESVLPKSGSTKKNPLPGEREESQKETKVAAMLAAMTKNKIDTSKIETIDVIVLAPNVAKAHLKHARVADVWTWEPTKVVAFDGPHTATIHTIVGGDARQHLGGLVQALQWLPTV